MSRPDQVRGAGVDPSPTTNLHSRDFFHLVPQFFVLQDPRGSPETDTLSRLLDFGLPLSSDSPPVCEVTAQLASLLSPGLGSAFPGEARTPIPTRGQQGTFLKLTGILADLKHEESGFFGVPRVLCF